MKNKYERILEEQGEEAAKQYMRDIRAKVKNHPGGSFRDVNAAKEASKLAAEAREKKREK